jgi:hypothetical protein
LGSERLDNELMRAYLLDDLAWQLSRQQDEAILGDLWAAFGELEQRNRAEAKQQEASEERPLVLFEQPSLSPSGDAASGMAGRLEKELGEAMATGQHRACSPCLTRCGESRRWSRLCSIFCVRSVVG